MCFFQIYNSSIVLDSHVCTSKPIVICTGITICNESGVGVGVGAGATGS